MVIFEPSWVKITVNQIHKSSPNPHTSQKRIRKILSFIQAHISSMKNILSTVFAFSTAFFLWWILDVIFISAVAYSALGHLPQKDGDFGFMHFMDMRYNAPSVGNFCYGYLVMVAVFGFFMIPISLIIGILKPILKLPIDRRLWLLGLSCLAIMLFVLFQFRLGLGNYGYCFFCWFDG